ncbi:alpha/beta hydrolase [Roseiarcaceae bacterium H3SJ34-1]|uniref:alpha/beta hydrolase n=1 Tax=Terripilifer ovatus TaxID=3032367 RepID=UPI003AB93BF2|nr:alpha/beta hydrolase [Roseiarcaceae bacterium H3SJ34-1]
MNPEQKTLSNPQFVTIGTTNEAHRIAYRKRKATAAGLSRPGVIWLGGFKSDMKSTKAERIDQWAEVHGRAFLRFDYSGHGESGGRFEDGTIGAWLGDSLSVIRQLSDGPQILVGSSMGGWISLLAARALAQSGEESRLAGLVLIAPAVDFTEALMWKNLPADARRDIEEKGVWLRHSDYSPEPYAITRQLIEDGRKHLLLDRSIRSYCPVHILQGMQDPDVPWLHAMQLVEHLAGDPVAVTLIKDGDHRLSRDEDIARLIAAIEAIA